MRYAFLRGKIVENCGTLSNFAKVLGISMQMLSKKLSGESSFSQEQMQSCIKILNLNELDFTKCFFIF